MATFPISLPAQPKLRDFTMRPRRSASSHESPFSLQEEIQVFSGRLWELEFTLPPITSRTIAENWITTLMLLDGQENTILIGDPDATSFLGDLTASVPLVDGASQTGTTLNIKGLDPNKTGVFLPGDYFQLGTGVSTRLYKNLEQVDADGTGLATMLIWPNLRESPADSEALITTSPKGTFRLSGGEMPWTTNVLSHYAFRFAFREAF